jgi:signal transduction histidine kinase
VEESADPNREDEQFFAEVADGLHALAQPLSILRSAIELIALSQHDNGRYLNVAAQQMERTAKIFSSLQHLVSARLDPARCGEMDLCELVQPIVADWKPSLDAFGIELACDVPELPLMAIGDPQRAEQTITAVLEAAASNSARGDRIDLKLNASESAIECTVESTRRSAQRVNSAGRLSLALARWCMASQQGEFEFREDPFRASLLWTVVSEEKHRESVRASHAE